MTAVEFIVHAILYYCNKWIKLKKETQIKEFLAQLRCIFTYSYAQHDSIQNEGMCGTFSAEN